jgi:subtilisin family serine protease
MQKTFKLNLLAVTAMMAFSTGAPAVFAGDANFALHARGTKGPPSSDGGDSGGGETTVTPPPYYGWMSPGILDAWKDDFSGNFAFLGQDVGITVVDDFTSGSRLRGDLGDGRQRLRHGEWTLKQAGMIAPSANMIARDFNDASAVSLTRGFNVLSLSYGYIQPLDRKLEQSIVTIAGADSAFIAKSAGNEYGLPVGQRTDGGSDYLSLGLIGALSDTGYDSTIFVGALDWNVVGTGDPDAKMATYSSIAGDDARVQRQFLVVGVEAASGGPSFGTGLAGTSFAAPIVAGYAAVLESKFPGSAPSTVAQRLLETARTNTIVDYAPNVHGRGEANIFRAAAPDAINK